MKQLIKRIVVNALVIALVAYIMPGLSYGGDVKNLLLAATVLSLANSILKPFLKILLLPLNVITLGLFGWFINVIILYIVTLIVPLTISGFTITLFGTTLVLSQLLAFILISFTINLVGGLVSWILG